MSATLGEVDVAVTALSTTAGHVDGVIVDDDGE